MRGPVLAVVVVAAAVGGVTAYFSTRGPSATLPPGQAPATATAASTTPAGTVAEPLKEVIGHTGGGSGAVLADEEARYPTPEEIAKKATVTHVLDYVCKKQVPIETEISAMHMGATYKFCSQECRDKFAANPEAFFNK